MYYTPPFARHVTTAPCPKKNANTYDGKSLNHMHNFLIHHHEAPHDPHDGHE